MNANFRYLPHEIDYILDNSDSALLAYDARLSERIEALDPEIKSGCQLVEVGSNNTPDGVSAFEDLIMGQNTDPLEITRSPDDLLFVHTGGTTGKPKGVMWPHKEQAIGLLGGAIQGKSAPQTVDELIAHIDAPKPYLTPLIASPLMHGAGLYSALTTFFNSGHIVVTDNGKAFDPALHWQLVTQHSVDAISLAGDTFVKPLFAELERGNYDVSTVKIVGSSGVLWSLPVKQALLKHMPQAVMYDALRSSEAMGLGASIMTADGLIETATFKIGPSSKVFTEDGREILPGSGEAGYLARSGPMPLGYYKDDAKTAETFRTFNGVRYAVPGDLCKVDADGTIHLLGRGSHCINTGGEKVFPTEVEEAIKAHEAYQDALVFGTPDPKWGNAVMAVARLEADTGPDADTLKTFLRERLAGNKLPKQIIFTQEDLRLANGKPNYALARDLFGLTEKP